jgi:phosphorylcholine metabolism protein LicD
MAKRNLQDPMTAQAAVAMLKELTALFERRSIRYALTAGTLLGVVREGRLLPWDSDMDVSVFADDLPRLRSAIREIEAAGYLVRTGLHTRSDPPFSRGDLRILKIWNRRWGLFKGGLLLDGFVKVRHEGFYFWAVGGEKQYARKAVPARFYDTLETLVFEGKTFAVPSCPTEYLALRYGADWRTPRTDWNYARDDGAIVPGGKGVGS